LPGAGERFVRFGIGVLAVEPIVERLDRRVGRRSPHRPQPDGSDHAPDPRDVGDGAGRSGPDARWGVVEVGRLEVTMAAFVFGYFLLDTIELPDGQGPAGAGWSRVRRLAVATEADALLVHGPVDPQVVEPFAAELRLMVRAVRDVIPPPLIGPSPADSSPAGSWSGWLGAWGAAPAPPRERPGR
jgi:hypothetical protein